jgi:hypothetical protein
MTLPGVCFFEGVKDGKFSLMSEYKKPKSEEKQDEEQEVQQEEGENKDDKKSAGEDPDKSLPVLPLALIGGVLATGALLTIFFTIGIDRWCFSNRCFVDYFLDS